MVKISDYNLPVKQPSRNFPQVVEEHFVGPLDFKQGDTAGTTETDSKTAPKSGGYTRINR
jgi:hypothetical protein